MPYTDSGLWIPNEVPRKQKSERRPHRLTIVLNLIYTAVTGGSLILAFIALRQNTKSFELANQPYLALTNMVPSFDKDNNFILHFDMSSHGTTVVHDIYIYNSLFPVLFLEPGMRVDSGLLVPVSSLVPGESKHIQYTSHTSLREFPIQILGFVVLYTSTFGEHQRQSYCWQIDFNSHTAYGQCDVDIVSQKIIESLVP
jgi:hypothetical protein